MEQSDALLATFEDIHRRIFPNVETKKETMLRLAYTYFRQDPAKHDIINATLLKLGLKPIDFRAYTESQIRFYEESIHAIDLETTRYNIQAQKLVNEYGDILKDFKKCREILMSN